MSTYRKAFDTEHTSYTLHESCVCVCEWKRATVPYQEGGVHSWKIIRVGRVRNRVAVVYLESRRYAVREGVTT